MDKQYTCYKRPESALVLVYTADLQVLLLKRVTPPCGIWQSVTGSLAWDEQPPAAAQRELQEETGLHFARDALQATGVINRFEIVPESRGFYAPGTTENTEHVFRLCLPASCPVQLNPAEHSESCWLPAQQALEKTWSWSNKAAIEALITLNA